MKKYFKFCSFLLIIAFSFSLFVTKIDAETISCPEGYTCTQYSSSVPGCPAGYSCTKVTPPPPSPSCYVFTTDLALGSTGSEVTALQKLLIAKGFDIPNVSSGSRPYGSFGTNTQNALMRYQRSKDLTANGRVDAPTRAKLNDCGPTPYIPPVTPPVVSSSTQTATFALNSQKRDETWQKSTSHKVSWTGTNFPKGSRVNVYLSPLTGTGVDHRIGKNVLISKGGVKVAIVNLNRIPNATYRVKVMLVDRSGARFLVYSLGKVTVAKAPPPYIQITNPQAGTTWDRGNHRVTWIANFKRIQVKGGDADDYAGIIITRPYGVGPDARSLDLSGFSKKDREIILKLKPADVKALSKLSDSEMADFDPGTTHVAELSQPAVEALMYLSEDGIDQLKQIDFLGIGEFAMDGTLDALSSLINTDPLWKAAYENDPLFKSIGGALFGDDEPEIPEKVNIRISAIPMNGSVAGTPIKLGASYLEKGWAPVSFKKLQPGKYKLRIVANLPRYIDKKLGGGVKAETGIFTIVDKVDKKDDDKPATSTPPVSLPVGDTLEFGGMYSSSYPNPITKSPSCPGGFTSTKVMGASLVDTSVYYCHKVRNGDEVVTYDFGGIYGLGNPSSYPNPVTNGQSCQTTFTSSTFKGAVNSDYTANFCYRNHSDTSSGALQFGGMYGYGAGDTKYVNPYTKSTSCPTGFTARQFSGATNSDFRAFYCSK